MSFLNDEQQSVIEEVQNGKNIFLTGLAGSGKSFCVKTIISDAQKAGLHIGITGMTGSAAILIGGVTIHSFMGIGLAKDTPENLVIKIKKNKVVYQKLKAIDLLIIDEVSMLSNNLLEKINSIFKIIKRSDGPFGGVQIVLVGDFFQLKSIEHDYCFMSPCFASFKKCVLTTNMRQKDDTIFKDILERVRWGECSPEDLVFLKSLRSTKFPKDIVPTKLFARNAETDTLN